MEKLPVGDPREAILVKIRLNISHPIFRMRDWFLWLTWKMVPQITETSNPYKVGFLLLRSL